jgi:hypothetical protein
MLRALLLALGSLLWPLAAHAQPQQAACTFNFFSPTTPFKLPDGTPVFIQPRGINDFGTIVGYSSFGTPRGLIRWANGGVTRVHLTSYLNARNDHGTSVGICSANACLNQGILVNGTTITPIVLDVNNDGVFEVNGINRWATIVGVYRDPDHFGAHGFKRWNNGTTHTLDFPGALPGSTDPLGINDNGTVVGSYATPDDSIHGFIFHNGHWATLDYPHAENTVLVGISNAGKIIGYAHVNASIPNFLYENGIFKVISVPNLVAGVRSISPKRGLILGAGGTGSPAFIAQCR